MFLRRIILAGLVVVLASATPAFAQSCKERFIEAATKGNGEGQFRQIVTQNIKGGAGDTVHEFVMNSHQHWLVKPIEPKGIGWTLLYDGAMYSSLDEGGSWKEITKFDEKAAQAARDQQKRDVEAVTDLNCDEDTIEGTPFDRIHGQYEVTVGFKNTQIHTYWIDPASKVIVRSTYETVSPSFNSSVTQELIPFDDAVVPVP